MKSEASNQEVRFQLRRDLQFADYPVGFNQQTVIKDPLKMEYFLFNSIEHSILQMLRQPCTLGDLKLLADQKYAEAKIEISELKLFLKRLLSDNLVVANTTGLGASQLLARSQTRRAKWLQMIFSVLAIRIRGVNPQSFLDAFNPITQFLFRPAFLLIAVVMFIAALATLVLNAGRIFDSEFLWQSIQSPRILLPIALALMVVKILHELGHAFACRSIGRDCNEMGLLLLAFVPCLYCNVSDVWMESNRWKRMLVSAAGIYVEMLIATACVPLWLFSNHGDLQLFWFTLMTICSVNTLLINGNPLLRYDGYYLLSDSVGIPNLYSEAQQALSDRVSGLFVLGVRPRPFSWLEIYGVAAFIYRYLIVGVIVLTVYMFFARMQLESLGGLVAMTIGGLTFVGTAYGSTMKLIRLKGIQRLRGGRVGWTMVIALMVLIGLLIVPIRTKVYSTGKVAYDGNRILFAPEAGGVDWLVTPGQRVKAGQAIARIKSRELELEVQKQKLYVRESEAALEHLQLLLSRGAENTREIELQKHALVSAKRIEAELQHQLRQLTVVTEVAGKLTAMPTAEASAPDELDLQRTSSTLANSNQVAFVASGEPLAVIAASEEAIIRLDVPERYVNRVAVGQDVKLLIRQYSPELLLGEITDVAIDTPGDRQNAVFAGEENETVVVTARLSKPTQQLYYQSDVSAAILGERQSLYRVICRFFTENFN